MTTISNGATSGSGSARTIDNAKDVARRFGTDALADAAVTAPKLAPGAVDAADIPDGSITTAKLGALAVTGAKIAAGTVTKAKTAMFVSTEQTGTGAPQNVAHGLGVAPTAVLIVPTDTAPATAGDYTAVEGAHDATNVIATVTTGKKFKVWAMA